MRAESVSVTLVPGDGPTVVFLHGLFGQGKNFTTIAKALAPGHQSLLVDLPNHGASAWTASVDYADMAESVAEAIRQALPGERVAVVGHSMGGKVAMVLALRHPDLVERLAVVDISPVSTSGMSEFEGLLDALATLDLGALSSRREADAALRELIPNDATRGFLLQNLQHKDGSWSWKANLELLRRDLGNIGDFPEGLDAAPYAGPVLWVAGGESPYVRLEHAEPMRALFPRVRRVTVKDSGHWVHAEQTAIFTEILRAFLAAANERG